jgi:hypothetical protein
MTAAKYRYELWVQGDRIAKYKTLGQALLGALWRSEEMQEAVFVYKAGVNCGACLARVAAGHL